MGIIWNLVTVLFFVATEKEVAHVRNAFKRRVGNGNFLPKSTFFNEVLGELVPVRLAEVKTLKLFKKFIPCVIVLFWSSANAALCIVYLQPKAFFASDFGINGAYYIYIHI